MILTLPTADGEARRLMWIRHVFLGLAGLTRHRRGISQKTFAFLIMLNIIPRMIGKTKTAARICLYENMIVLGGIGGNLLSVFLMMRIPLGHIFLGVYGICAGLFVGCVAVALAEILKTFPVIFRRTKVKVGLWVILWFMALGKTAGSLFYFIRRLSDS